MQHCKHVVVAIQHLWASFNICEQNIARSVVQAMVSVSYKSILS